MHVFIFWLSVSSLSIIVAFISLILVFTSNAPATWLLICVLAALTTFLIRYPVSSQVAIRTGRCCPKRYYTMPPCDMDTFLNHLREEIPSDTTLIRVVGSGWGFFLKRGWAQRGRDFNLYMHNFKGRMINGSWRAGTTVKHLHGYLKQRGRVFASQPTMADISVGSWVASGNHGNGGDLNAGTAVAFSAIYIVNLFQPDELLTMNYKQARDIFDSRNGSSYCVVAVDINEDSLPKDVMLHQVGSFISVSDWTAASKMKLQRWLSDGAVLRVLFVGGAKSHATGIRWQMASDYAELEHQNPHCCSRFARYCQADICSAICGCTCGDSERSYFARELYSSCNLWTPPMLPIYLLATICGGIYNCEFIFVWPSIDEDCYEFLIQLYDIHRRCGGRSEIRYSGKNKSVFLDVTVRKKHFQKIVNLMDKYKIRTFTIHAGKYDPFRNGDARMNPSMRRTSLHDIYYNPRPVKLW